MKNRDTAVERAKALKNAIKSCRMSASPCFIVWKFGPNVNATFVKMLYIIAGNCRAGILARKVFTK